jgi:hypothetical protein
MNGHVLTGLVRLALTAMYAYFFLLGWRHAVIPWRLYRIVTPTASPIEYYIFLTALGLGTVGFGYASCLSCRDIAMLLRRRRRRHRPRGL